MTVADLIERLAALNMPSASVYLSGDWDHEGHLDVRDDKFNSVFHLGPEDMA